STTFNDVAGLNQWVWNLLRATNPNSVFLNYQLVDVLWANSPATVPAASVALLTAGNPLPNPAIHKVANTTMETYFQNSYLPRLSQRGDDCSGRFRAQKYGL